MKKKFQPDEPEKVQIQTSSKLSDKDMKDKDTSQNNILLIMIIIKIKQYCASFYSHLSTCMLQTIDSIFQFWFL